MKAFEEEICPVAMGRTDWTRSGDQAEVAAGLKGRWRGGEKQLDWGVFGGSAFRTALVLDIEDEGLKMGLGLRWGHSLGWGGLWLERRHRGHSSSYFKGTTQKRFPHYTWPRAMRYPCPRSPPGRQVFILISHGHVPPDSSSPVRFEQVVSLREDGRHFTNSICSVFFYYFNF